VVNESVLDSENYLVLYDSVVNVCWYLAI